MLLTEPREGENFAFGKARYALPDEQLLAHFNDRAATYQRAVCLHQLFESQVERAPEAVAIVSDELQLTYQEFNTRANQLAHRLRKLGVQAETLVGVCLDRSPALMIALYAILKAGGAYVPFDPSYPQERLDFMAADTNVAVLLTQKKYQEKIAGNAPTHMLCLETEAASIAQENDANLSGVVTENNLAYVIYTSGSTGKPKGVMIEHRGICNQLQWMQAAYPLTNDDAVLLRTPFSFDLSLYEIFSPLIGGARLVLADPAREKDTTYITAVMQQQKITTLFLVPSMLQMLLAAASFAQCQSLQHIFCSGEALPFALQQKFFAHLPAPVGLHNLYGPTEASVECTVWDCERDTQRNFVPVGRPIANYQICILDEFGQPAPIGTAGELHIGGIGLARGYWNRPELTAEKFITKQATATGAAENSLRLYKTGDLARWHADGVIECLGRLDFQVKIRGHRIELGEIETALAAHAAVRECVVLAREDVVGDKQLVAYFVPGNMPAPARSVLREHLQQTLPAYMIPAHYVPLTSLPLSPNGKVDRKQLPAPTTVGAETATAIVAAANTTEQKLVEIWQQALRLQPISVTENFFEMGGHSLLAVQIFAAIENIFGKKLPLATLLHAPTIRQLAAVLSETIAPPSWSSLVALQPHGTKPPFFCIHAVGGNVLEYYDLAQHMAPDQPFYGLQAVGLDGKRAPLQSIAAMATQYLQELRQLQPQGPYYLGGRSFGGVVAYEMAQQLVAQGQTVKLVALMDTDPIGWLKRLPPRIALQYRLRFLSVRLQQHWQNVFALSWPERKNYVQEKIGYKKRKLATMRWQMARLLQTKQHTILTDVLREIEELNYRAAKNYVPAMYPGVVTFLAAQAEVSTQENIFGWQSLAAAGVKMITVPGDHQTMIKRPNVQLLAAQLKALLT